MEINKRMIEVMRECEAIGKTKENKQQGFKYRGIDQVYNMLHPILARHGIFMTTEVLDIKETTTVSSKGTVLFYKQAKIKFTFHAEDGSCVSSVINGEAMDSGDKATNKAMAIAHKYCLFQAFCLPTGEEDDPDATSHEIIDDPLNPVQQTPLPIKPKTPPAMPSPAPVPKAIDYVEVLKSQLDKACDIGLQTDVERFLNLALADGEVVSGLTQDRAGKVLSEFIKFAGELKKEKK